MKQTENIDDVECPYCGYKTDGNSACNGDMDCTVIECEKCKREYYVSMSIQYNCTTIED